LDFARAFVLLGLNLRSERCLGFGWRVLFEFHTGCAGFAAGEPVGFPARASGISKDVNATATATIPTQARADDMPPG
jgi:hypothetical protein